jgi:Zn-dependent protease
MNSLSHFRPALDRMAAHPILSVVLSMVGFSFLGPVASVIVVAVMLDHEFAHRWMMKRLGYDPGPVRLLPLVGAYVKARKPLIESEDVALIYLAGPLGGIVSAVVAALVARWWLAGYVQHQVYLGVETALILSLANLLPIEPLDGGLISRALPYRAFMALPILVGIAIIARHVEASSLALLVLGSTLLITLHKISTWQRYELRLRQRAAKGDVAASAELEASFAVPFVARVMLIGAYLLLVPITAIVLWSLLHHGVMPALL